MLITTTVDVPVEVYRHFLLLCDEIGGSSPEALMMQFLSEYVASLDEREGQ